MTLMPVAIIVARGSSWSKAGGLRWISQWSSIGPMSSVSRGWPITLKTWPRTASPTGTVMPRPDWRTTAPRTRPSVGFMHTQRTRPSPICWATSATTVIFTPSRSMSISTAWLISGSECGGNSTSTTGPAIATTRPVSRVVVSGAMVIGVSLSRAERFGAAHDFHDFGRNRVLARAVHDAREALAELVRVLRRGGHGALLGGVEGGRALEERREDLALQGPGRERGQQLLDLGLELGVALEAGGRLEGGVGRDQGQELLGLDDLGAGREEAGGHEEDLVDLAVDVGRGDDARDLARVGEGGAVGDADEALLDLHAAEAEEGGGLLAHRVEAHGDALFAQGPHQALTGAQDRRVVGPRQSPVAGDHEHQGSPDALGRVQQPTRGGRVARGGLEDDAAHALAKGPVGDDARLGPGDLGGGDELHRLGDLARGLHRLDAPSQDPFLSSRHGPSVPLGAGLVARREGRDEVRHRRVERVGVGQRAGRADLLEQLWVGGAKGREQLGLEAAHVGHRDRVEPAAGAGVDHDALLLDGHRGVEALLQDLGEAISAVELGLGRLVELGAEGRE